MTTLQKYENMLKKKYNLPDTRCVYTPAIYWRALEQTERNHIHHLREAERQAYSRMP